MAGTDWDFVFDGVFGFLISPMWQIPVATFTEKHCEVFDPSEESSMKWSDLHTQYRSLVENLLASYLKDVGITEEQFVKACSTPAAQQRPQMQVIFEQIWAAEDFEIFKRMMIQKNIELQLQALQLIQERQGLRSSKEPQGTAVADEDEILSAVLRHSKEEYERSLKGKAKEEQNFDSELEEAIARSEREAQSLREAIERQEAEKQAAFKATFTKEKAAEEKQPEVTHVTKEAKEKSPTKESKTQEPAKSKSPTKVPSPLEKKPEGAISLPKPGPVSQATQLPSKPDIQPTKAKASTATVSPVEKKGGEGKTTDHSSIAASIMQSTMPHSEEEIKRREDYLRQQRDRLLAMKKKEREKQLSTFSESQPKRPASAKAAREAVSEVSIANQSKAVTVDDPKKLAMRRALAERLKKEVIDKEGSW